MSRIFGVVRQNGYVVSDVEAATRHWAEVLGASSTWPIGPKRSG